MPGIPGYTDETDYDDLIYSNGKIEVSNLDQLNAIRYDLDGDSFTATGDDAVAYAKAFPGLTPGMGCWSHGCRGYELAANLDFDTDGDGDVDANDPNSYANWAPIGDATTPYTADFSGSGYIIANLTISRSATDDVGLFGRTDTGASLTGVGLLNVNITGQDNVGALAGTSGWSIYNSWSTGTVNGRRVVGGLVGQVGASASDISYLRRSYSRASVNASAANNPGSVGAQTAGGLVGRLYGGIINTAYAAGAVSATGHAAGGLVGFNVGTATVAAAYWDTEATGQANASAGTLVGTATGLNTAGMQSPTAPVSGGAYAGWSTIDWDFGTDNQYPALRSSGLVWQGRGAFAFTQQPSRTSVTVLTVTEGAAAGATYGVSLAVPPANPVRVTVTSDNTAVTIDGPDANSVFSASETLNNFSSQYERQLITIKAAEDADVCDLTTTLTLTAADPPGATAKSGYAGVTRTAPVTVVDNDPGGIVLTKGTNNLGSGERGLAVPEQGSDITYEVALSAAPAANVTVTVSSGDSTKVQVKNDGDAGFSGSTTLTFTPTDYATTQTVTLRGLDDSDLTDDVVTISHTAADATATASCYDDPDDSGPRTAVSKSLNTFVRDNDAPRLITSLTSLLLELTEATTGNGHQTSFNVRLQTQPTAAVTVAISGSDLFDSIPAVQLSKDGGATYGNSVSLTFNPTGTNLWSADQRVDVQARQDNDGDENHTFLNFRISGGDYDRVTHRSVRIDVADDDPKGITLSETGSLAVSEGATASYTVKLDTAPGRTSTATAQVSVSSSDSAKVLVSARSDGGFAGSLTLTYNASNYNTAQTVYVRNDDEDTVSETDITISHTGSGGGYGDPDGAAGPLMAISATLPLTLTDTSTPGLLLSPSALRFKEGYERDYTVRLTTIPASNVTVAISRDAGSAAVTFDDASDGSFAATGSLTFTANNWNDPQSVKVRTPQVTADTTATLSHTASGADYAGVSSDLRVNVRNNRLPAADAGPDQEGYSGQTITLDGSRSRDPDDAVSTLSYSWRQSAGSPPMTLAGRTTARASFVVPTTLTADTEVEFELTVRDPSGAVDTDRVKVKLLAARPNELVTLSVTAGAGDDAVRRPLTPTFASAGRSFDAYVDAYTATAQIAMTPADPAARVSFNGDAPTAGARTVRVGLAEGNNPFTIVVTPRAQGLSPITYHLNIIAKGCPAWPSSRRAGC